MKDCIKNNYAKIELKTDLLFKIHGKSAFKPVLENILHNIDTYSAEAFLMYISNKKTGENDDIDMLINKISNVANNNGINGLYSGEYTISASNEILEDFVKLDTTNITTPIESAPISKTEIAEYIDNEVDVTSTKVSDTIPEKSKIIKQSNARTLTDVYTTYLGDNLMRNPTLLKNSFKRLISKNWLSTNKEKRLNDNFDSVTIKKNILNDAYATIQSYYIASADGIVDMNINRYNTSVLLFEDFDRIPEDSKKYHSVSYANGPIDFYTSEYTKNVIFAVVKSVSDLDVYDLETGIRELKPNSHLVSGDIQKTSYTGLPKENKPLRIDATTANNNITDTGLISGYFSYIIVNNLDIFISSMAQELDSTFKEHYRKGPIRIDLIGTDMATKMTRLGIISTPKIHANSDNTKTLNKIKNIRGDINSTGDTIAGKLKSLDLIKSTKNTIFNTLEDGKQYSNVIINIGTTDLVFSYDHDNKIWVIPLFDLELNQRVKLTNTADIEILLNKNSQSINDNTKTGIIHMMNLLSDYDGKFDKFSKIVGIPTELATNTSMELIDSINDVKKLASDVDTINVSLFDDNNNDGFLRPADLITAAMDLSHMPQDPEEAGNFLLKLSSTNSITANVARALYYKYFHRGEYNMTQINPTTGLPEYSAHMSVYEKSLRYGDSVSWNALTSLIAQITSTEIDNKTFLTNGYFFRTYVQYANDVEYLISSIDKNGMSPIDSLKIGLLDGNIKDLFSVKELNNKLQIDFYKHGKKNKPEPTLSFTIDGNNVIANGDAAFNFSTITEILTLLKVPKLLNSVNVYDALHLALSSKSEPKSELHKFYAKIIAMRLANVINQDGSVVFDTNLNSNLHDKVKYVFKNNLNKFKDPLRDAISTVYTRAFTSVIEGPTGSKFSISVLSNLSKKKKELIARLIKTNIVADDNYIYKNSAFLTAGEFLSIKESLTRLGLSTDNDGKDTADLNQQELATVLVSSFIQHMGQSSFKEGISSEDAMSDRSKIDMFILSLTDEFGDLAPIYTENGKDYLDEVKLRNRFIKTQYNTFSALQGNLVNTWKDVIHNIDNLNIVYEGKITTKDVSGVDSLRKLYLFLDDAKIDYYSLLHKSGLVDNHAVVKDKNGYASIKYSLVQLSEVILAPVPDKDIKVSATKSKQLQANLDKKNLYIDMYFSEFMNYMDDVGYEISPQEIKVLSQERFKYLNDDNATKAALAKELALKLFFYNDSVFGQELIQFGMGNVFQYKSNNNIKSIFETIDNDVTLKNNKDKIQHILGINVIDGKTLDSMSYDELFNMGPGSNDLSSIKIILESNMSDKDKLDLIEYFDIFTQISPMYVDRVKRNQASGTSGIHPALASTNKAGMYLDKKIKSITIQDSDKKLFLLNTGETSTTHYDGAQIHDSSYAYKLNNSLGDKFSNFRSRSFFKTVNASKTEDGVSQYSKIASFSLFNWELMNYGTPEHSRINDIMMSKEAFNDSKYDATYDGLYLLPKNAILSPESAKYETQLNIDEVLLHGEYLGDLKVKLNTNTASSFEDMSVAYLIYAIDKGIITKDKITEIYTNKVKVSGDIIKNKLDLYDYYGGASTNEEILNKNTTEKDKKILTTEFPFGWVEYQITNIMSNYKGSFGNYPIRNAEINTIIFESGMKTGRRNVNPSTILTDVNTKSEDVISNEVSNEFLYVILNAEHGHDVTEEYNISEEAQENSSVAMMTQVFSNATAQGATKVDVEKMNSAIANLTELQLNLLEEEIQGFISITTDVEHDSAARQWSVDLLRRIILTRKGGETTMEALGITAKDASDLAFDLRMIAPLLRSSVNAEYNRRGIKLRFPGGQYVLTPIEFQMKTYSYANNNNLLRNSMIGKGSVNNIISNEVLSKNFTGEFTDSAWRLKVIDTIEQLKTSHAEQDIVYEIVRDNNGDILNYKAIRASTLLRNNKTSLLDLSMKLNAGEYVSPWIPYTEDEKSIRNYSGKNLKGNDLKWINYFKNGVSLYDTDEFLSYYLSGKAPKDLVDINTGNSENLLLDKLEYFKTELSTNIYEVPKLLWARFIINSGISNKIPVSLSTATVLGENTIRDAYELFNGLDTDTKLLDSFFLFVEEYKGNEQQLAAQMRIQLEVMLEEDKNWHFKEAEFYLPPHHQAAFLIAYGDSIQDIVGTQEQPDLAKLASIIGLTEDEKSLLSKYYIDDSTSKMNEIKIKIINSNNEYANKYLELRKIQQEKMLLYFKNKISNIEKDIATASDKELSVIKSRAPLMYVNNLFSKNIKNTDILIELQNLILNDSVLSNKSVRNTVLQTIQLLENNDYDSAQLLIRNKNNLYKVKWKSNLANNFEKSLTFITSRIPAQAKQQTTVGKIKNFIYSTRNAIYTPIEMLAVSGADYDIDKQNNITWNVSADGKIFDWEDITNSDDNLAIKRIKTDLKEASTLFKRDLDDLSNLPGNKDEIEAYKLRVLNKFNEANLDKISKKVQNYVLNKIIKISGSSKNAIESATSVAMNKLGVIKDYLSSYNFKDLDPSKLDLYFDYEQDPINGKVIRRTPSAELIKLIRKKQLAIPYSPSTKMFYEKINMDGKRGIAIFASAIKGYMAVFNSSITNTAVKEFNSSMEALTDMEDAVTDIDKFYEDRNNDTRNKQELKYIKFNTVNEKPISVIWKNPETGLYVKEKDLEYVANTRKFIPKTQGGYPAIHTELAKRAYKELRFAITSEQEANIILKYKESLVTDAGIKVENQAWMDLSELLSAATDNAKELILGQIGADNTTSSVIATMIVMGVDLNAILLLINDPIIKKEVKAFEKSKTLINNNTDFKSTFKELLQNQIHLYDSVLADTDLIIMRNSVKKKLFNDNEIKSLNTIETKKDKLLIDGQLNIQQKLHSKYNPAKQLFVFTTAAREFSTLTGILGVNTGMKNSELDIFNYLIQVERAVTNNYRNGSLEDFLSDNANKREEMFKNANTSKTAFNIPYILYSNKHFYNYIKVAFKANSLMRNLTYTTDILHSTIKPLLKEAGRVKLEKEDLMQYTSLLANISISTYYAKPEIDSIVTVPGFDTYDLSKADDRLRFITDMPTIKDNITAGDSNLMDNEIIKKLQATDLRTDYVTGKTLLLLGGINIDLLEDGDISEYKVAMKALKKDSPLMHDLLFKYSMILDKGGLSKTSIAVLFGFEPYKKFNSHVLNLKVSGEMKELIEDKLDKEILGVLVPATLKRLSTQAKFKNQVLLRKVRNYDKSSDYFDNVDYDTQEVIQDISDVDEVQDYAMMDDETFNKYAKKNKLYLKYDTSNITKIKTTSSKYKVPNIFVSETNKLIYKYFEHVYAGETLKMFIPITKDIPDIVGNIDVSSSIGTDNLNKNYLLSIGYDYGWDIITPLNEHVRLLSYAGNNNYYILRKNYKNINGVLVTNTEIDTLTETQVRDYNPQFNLNRDAIIVRKGGSKPAKKTVLYWNKNTNTRSVAGQSNTNTIEILPETNLVSGRNSISIETKLSDSQLKFFSAKNKYKSNKVSMSDLISGTYDAAIEDYFTSIAASILNMDLKDKGENLERKYEVLKELRVSDDYNTQDDLHLQRLINFENSLFADASKQKLFLFFRKSNEEKLKYINKEVLGNTNLKESVINVRNIKSHLNKTEYKNNTKTINDFGNKEFIKADLEFLLNYVVDDVISVDDYLNIINKLGITPKKYRELKGIDVLLTSNKVYANPVKKVKFNAPIDLKIANKDRKNKIKTISPKVVIKLASFLNKRFSNSTIRTLNLVDIKYEYPNLDLKNNEEAFVSVGNNTIILIKERATLDSFLHEMGHLYLAELKDKNLKLYQEIMKDMRRDASYNDVNNIYSKYKNYTEYDILEEIFVAKLTTMHSDDFNNMLNYNDVDIFSGILSKNGNHLGQPIGTLISIFEEFLGGKIKDSSTITMKSTIIDIIRSIGVDLIFNKNSSLQSLNRNDIKNLKLILNDNNLTKDEAIKMLMDNNLIRKICE